MNVKPTLHRRILDAHASGSKSLLVMLYRQAADYYEENGDDDAAGFFLTQAYIFALEQGSDITGELHGRLVELGREA